MATMSAKATGIFAGQTRLLYITGYFEETKIPLVYIGQNADSLMSGGPCLAWQSD